MNPLLCETEDSSSLASTIGTQDTTADTPEDFAHHNPSPCTIKQLSPINGSSGQSSTTPQPPTPESPRSKKRPSADSLAQEEPVGKKAKESPGHELESQPAMERPSSIEGPAAHFPTTHQPSTPEARNSQMADSITESPNSEKRALAEPSAEEGPASNKMKDSTVAQAEETDLSTVVPGWSNLPATKHDKEAWQGFCEIESEPAYFSVILREMGVQDVTVREVFSMDPDSLADLPQPIHGLILLFRYREFGTKNQASECPANVWFANQLPGQSSCGTLAMLNILMNSPEVAVGDHLEAFKDFTSGMAPYQRGEALASFDFVKKIHNSFAKKMDLLENDKHLHSKVKRAQRQKELDAQPKSKAKDKTTSKTRSRRFSPESVATDDSAESFEENGHHFIAFVPVGNEVYKLDGMDAQPTRVGSFAPDAGQTWLDGASDTISTLMAAGDNEYGVLALIQSPVAPLRRKACLAISTIACVEARLDTLDALWREFVVADQEPTSPRLLGIEDLLHSHPVPASLATTIHTELLPDLLARRNSLVEVLGGAAAAMMEDMAQVAAEEEMARRRRYDGGPMLQKWLEMLAGNGWLEANLKRFK